MGRKLSILILCLLFPFLVGYSALMMMGGSDTVVETEADYTEFWWSGVDGQSWFGGDNLAANLFDQDGGSGGAGDKGAFTLVDLRLAELNSGNLTIDKIYEISARNTEDFTADGAPDNNVGTTFIATGTNVTLDADDKVYPIDISWFAYGINQVSIDNNALRITYEDDAGGAYLYFKNAADLSSNLTISQLYKVQFDMKVNGGSSLSVRIWSGGGGGVDTNSVTITNTEYQTFVMYFTASDPTGATMRFRDFSAGEVIWFDNITIQAVTSPADYADSGAFIRVCSSGGTDAVNCAIGYIGEAGSGETLGNELLANPSFDSNTTGWTPQNSAALASVAGGVSNNALRITENGAANPYAVSVVVPVGDKEYKAARWVKQGTEATYRSYSSFTSYTDKGDVEDTESTAVWVYNEWYGVASDNSESLVLVQRAAQASGTTIFFDEASFKEVTEPNPNSVMIYKEPHLATEGWLTIGGSFDPNDINTFTISQ